MRRAAWLAVAAVSFLASAAYAEAPPCPLTRGETHAVAQVFDGETLTLDDGRHLRLIGALAPRAGDVGAAAGGWPPENDARAALAALVEGRSIALWHDTVQRDRYGQVLAHATIGDQWLQGALVSRGHARAYGRPGVDACTEALAKLERNAREGGLGLWENAAYRVRVASRGDWVRAAGTFQVVSGTVHRVSRGSGEIFVSLAARSGRAYPLAGVLAGNRSDLTGGVAPRALIGRRVLVRGWVEQRRGPVIIVDSRGQLELLE
jgi:endonuclease YncB( thermonuclease family)